MQQFTELKTIRITKQQSDTLDKLKTYKINVSAFIRIAIAEKIKRDYKSITSKKTDKSNNCPF